MTTSLLMTNTREPLCANDLQVIRDFALESPWNWRVALERLVEMAEDEAEREELELQVEGMKLDCADLAKELEDKVQGLRKVYDEGVIGHDDLKDFETAIGQILRSLRGAE